MDALADREQYELYFFLEQHLLAQEDPIYKENTSIAFDLASIYQEVSIRYFEQTGIKLDSTKDENQKQLYEWIQQKERYHLLTEQLKLMLDCIANPSILDESSKPDYFLITNLLPLVNIMNDEGVRTLGKTKPQVVPLSYHSDREINKLVEEILVEIDPTEKWLSIYQRAQEEGSFIDYLSLPPEMRMNYQMIEEPDGSLNATFLTSTGQFSFVTYQNTLEDVATILHEFTHYIYYEKNKEVASLTLREFSPIFYEKYGLLSLSRKGYPLEELLSIDRKRRDNTGVLARSNACLYNYLSMLLQDGTIREEKDISFNFRAQNKILSMMTNKMKRDIKTNSPEFFDPIKFSHINCDFAVMYLIRHPESFYTEYPYVVGTHFATKAINNLSKNQAILVRMKEYTEKANEIDPYLIFEGIGGNPRNLGLTPIDQDLKTCLQKKKSLF